MISQFLPHAQYIYVLSYSLTWLCCQPSGISHAICILHPTFYILALPRQSSRFSPAPVRDTLCLMFCEKAVADVWYLAVPQTRKSRSHMKEEELALYCCLGKGLFRVPFEHRAQNHNSKHSQGSQHLALPGLTTRPTCDRPVQILSTHLWYQVPELICLTPMSRRSTRKNPCTHYSSFKSDVQERDHSIGKNCRVKSEGKAIPQLRESWKLRMATSQTNVSPIRQPHSTSAGQGEGQDTHRLHQHLTEHQKVE